MISKPRQENPKTPPRDTSQRNVFSRRSWVTDPLITTRKLPRIESDHELQASDLIAKSNDARSVMYNLLPFQYQMPHNAPVFMDGLALGSS